MAAIDNLLKALSRNQMDAVVLKPGRKPFLRKGSVEHEVTSSELDAGKIARLLAEVAPGGTVPDAATGAAWSFDYRLGEALFRFNALPGPAGWTAWAAAEAAVADSRQPITGIVPLLLEAVERRASDLHLSSDRPPWARVDGDLVAMEEFSTLTSQRLRELLDEIMPPRNREELERDRDTDFSFEVPGKARFRVNCFEDRMGVGAVCRQIPYQVPTAEALGLPEVMRGLVHLPKGLVLVTGPTGSGKSTTLAALIDLVNEQRRDHVITIEDPIEFVHVSKRCLIHQREVGVHTGSFARALRAALREDPDIVLVGEMRDLETTAIAIETAATGHLVFATLHTTSAPATIERLVDQFPVDEQSQIRLMLADSLRAVISQNLLKKKGGGRVAAYEILISTPGIANMIREGKTFQIPSAMQTGRKLGMRQLNDSLSQLVEKGIVEAPDAYAKAVDKDDLLNRLRAAGIDVSLLGGQ